MSEQVNIGGVILGTIRYNFSHLRRPSRQTLHL